MYFYLQQKKIRRNDMIARTTRISVILIVIFFTFVQFYLYGQERQDATLQAQQHYEQGKALYSQGRFKEANLEFNKATELMNKVTIEKPAVEYMEKIQQEASQTIAPAQSTVITLPQEKLVKKEEKEAEVTQAVSPQPAPEQKTEEKEYCIDIGDVLDVSVWQIPDLSRPEVIVRPDGKISYPLIGDIKAEGLTMTQLDGIITEKLKVYVKSPEVSIMIRRFGEQANKVIVLGEILAPGVYKFGGPPTITEVIASAGGYTKYAVLNSIIIVRGDVRTKPEVLRVNFAQIIKGQKLSENIFLKPNDIIYVPRSFIGKLNTFLEILQPAINEYMQTLDARHLQNAIHSKGGI